MDVGVIGRAAALVTVGEFLASAVTGARVLLIDGEPGIGKTTLWRAAVDEASGLRIVLSGQPAAAESALPYAALADLLRDVDDAVLDTLPDPQRRAIDQVLLRTSAGTDPTGHRATGAAVLGILDRLATRRPVLLAIDDLQWADRSSVQVIEFAIRRTKAPVGLLATVRTEQGEPTPPALTLPDPDRLQRLRIGPLSLGALHELILSRTGRSFPRPTMARIHQVSGGNPFYALELVREFLGGTPTGPDLVLPKSLAGLVVSRIARLDPPVRRALLAAAAAAEPTVELVQQALAVDAATAQRLLEAGETEGLIDLVGAKVRFHHPLLITGVLGAAAPAEVRAMHRRLAGLVGAAEEQARHLALAAVRPDLETVDALDDAATLARRRGAPATAAELLELALRLGADTAARRIRLAGYLFDAGDPVRARELLDPLPDSLPAGRTRAEALLLLATVRAHDDSYREAADCLQRALDEAGDDLRLRVEISNWLVYVLVNLGRIPAARTLTVPMVAEAERLGDPGELAKALASSVMINFVAGQGHDQPTLDRALALEQLDRPTPAMLRPSLINGLVLAWSGRLDEGLDTLLALRRRCLDRGEESDLMFGAFHLVVIECWRGDLAAARSLSDDTLERAQQLGTDLPWAIAESTRSMVSAYLGDADTARAAARAALAIFERGSCLAVTVWPLVTLGFVELSVGDHRAAAELLGPLAAAAVEMGYGEPAAAPFAADAAEALIATGRLDEATTLVDQLEEVGRRLDRAWALALSGRCRCLLAAARGDLDGAAAAGQRALIEHERLPMPLERARTQLVLGQVHRRRRQKRLAADAIRAALATFDELGSRLWADRARAELDRVNVPRGGSTELTPSERRVAELAAAGRTNREVAQAMFIHPKTVEANLARVYRKLGIHSRAELGRRIPELNGPER
ncbi:AAA family ATPase [Microlunatus sp. GCM10028923]|uniref:AAA family ATPase n=1 Tax=Microlunatus sp. GCM10028923 TaxID=3273400 RepID=UPI0036173F5D